VISIQDAIQIITRTVEPLGTKQVPIDSSVGRILAEDIFADMDLPPFDRSQMDGFAIRADDVAGAPVELKIVGESAAGRGWHQELDRGEAVRIMTGAPVPAGADTVQKVELTSETTFASEDAQSKNGNVTIFEPIAAGKNIVRRGQEIKKGERVLKRGERINERVIATLAAFGYSMVEVSRRPSISVLTTGSEIVSVDEQPGPDQIRNSNSVMLKSMIESSGGRGRMLPDVSDDLGAIKNVIAAAAGDSDIVVITGGVSVGKYDLTKTALSEVGAEIFFDQVRLKPGKPAVFARLGETLIFGLPGNPVSAAVTFYLFVRRAILMMQRASDVAFRSGYALLTADVRAAKDRDTYLPAVLDSDVSGHLTVTPLRSQGSSDFVAFGRADALIFINSGDSRKAGDVVDVVALR
jgi:molybdopterin molybdotransferase